MKPVFVWGTFGGLVVKAVPFVMPFAQWHDAANWPKFTELPRKS